MPAVHPRLRHLWEIYPQAKHIYHLTVGLCLTEALVMILSSRSRFAGDHWAPVFALGGPVVFGALIGGVGLLILAAPFRRPAWVWRSLFVAAIVHFALAGVLGSAGANPTANLLGPVVFGWVGLQILNHREVYRSERKAGPA